MRGKTRQKGEGTMKEKEWVNSAFNAEVTEIIIGKMISEQRLKGGMGLTLQMTQGMSILDRRMSKCKSPGARPCWLLGKLKGGQCGLVGSQQGRA